MTTKRKLSLDGPSVMPQKRSRQVSIPKMPNSEDGDAGSNSYQPYTRVDPTYGQRHALPGLDELGEDGDDAGALEAIQYLQSVRTEAQNAPHLLVAGPRLEELKDCDRGREGYYSDGAYTGLPLADDPTSDAPSGSRFSPQYAAANGNASPVNPQEAYYAALLARFHAFRCALQHPSTASPLPPPNGAACSAAVDPSAKRSNWSFALRQTAPTGAALGGVTQPQVIRALERVAALLTPPRMGHVLEGRHVGAWAWALLGRCRDLGQMDSEDVAVLRELGKEALWVGRKIRMRMEEAMEVDEDEDESSEDDQGVESLVEDADGFSQAKDAVHDAETRLEHSGSSLPGIDTADCEAPRGAAVDTSQDAEAAATVTGSSEAAEELERAKQRLISNLANGSVAPAGSDIVVQARLDNHTEPEATDVQRRALATLDIIVTIVGEVYGQRDLLDAREVWGEFE